MRNFPVQSTMRAPLGMGIWPMWPTSVMRFPYDDDSVGKIARRMSPASDIDDRAAGKNEAWRCLGLRPGWKGNEHPSKHDQNRRKTIQWHWRISLIVA